MAVESARRLSAIMFTDMVGYTSASQEDESRTLRLREEQEALIRSIVSSRRGREVKSTGDGFLVEFASALDAVQCGIDIVQRLRDRNSKPGTDPIQVRIGIHLGDVEPRGDDIFGDSVNIAARIEPLAEPGGICISEPVFGQVHNKIPCRLEAMGPQRLKHVHTPMEVYRIIIPEPAGAAPPGRPGPTGLAVLPFANISPDPNDAYFAEGLTEELISVLSQLRSLRVIARTSVTPYRGTSKGVSDIGKELGVSSILEGSVRKAGNRLRITVQLIDVASQGHVWANNYDRELVDVFAIQAEIAREVAEALKITLGATEATRLETRPTARPDSYLAYLKGRTLLRDRSPTALASAREQFELAIRLDSRNASAYSGLSDVVMLQGIYIRSRNAADIEASRAFALHALELDPASGEAHASLAHALSEELRFAEAEQEYALSLSLNPSYSAAHHWYCLLLQSDARPVEALDEISRAEEADPLSVPLLSDFAVLLIDLGRLEDAGSKIEKLGVVENFGDFYHRTLARYWMAKSDPARALQELDELNARVRGDPGMLPWYAIYYAQTGRLDRALDYVRKIEEAQDGIPFKSNVLATVYAELGDLDAAFHWIDRAVEEQKILMWGWRMNPRLERFRTDPRFERLLERLKLVRPKPTGRGDGSRV